MVDADDLTRVMMALHPTVTMNGSTGEAIFHPQPEHRGNPLWLHGGLAATVLDHVCARVASAALGGAKVVTGTLDLRYPHPVPLADGPYLVRATHERPRSKVVRIAGAIVDASGKPMVEAKALFVLLEMPRS